jgi:hypothetical protein
MFEKVDRKFQYKTVNEPEGFVIFNSREILSK